MKVEMIKNTEVIQYDSLNEFYNYICKTPINDAFRWVRHGSVTNSERFTKTNNFEEAVDLFKHGWSDMAEKLVRKLRVIENEAKPIMKPKTTLGVCGYQAIVPLYLQGVPNNMVNKKMVPIKQKIITVNKSIDYAGKIKVDTIIEESIKAMQIIKKLEAQGLRVNLNIVLGTSRNNKSFVIKVKIKSANEKLNVSKIAFPLVHPSMLRRLFFRFIEVYPNIPSAFNLDYGYPATSEELRKIFVGEYLLPNFIMKDVNSINCIDDLELI